jgi:hypothetical protein
MSVNYKPRFFLLGTIFPTEKLTIITYTVSVYFPELAGNMRDQPIRKLGIYKSRPLEIWLLWLVLWQLPGGLLQSFPIICRSSKHVGFQLKIQ